VILGEKNDTDVADVVVINDGEDVDDDVTEYGRLVVGVVASRFTFMLPLPLLLLLLLLGV
jgi:hypothetical protein